MKLRQCIIDFAIVLITIPSLVVVALLLDYIMTHTGWTEKLESQIIMAALSVAFFLICIMVSVYLTHRVGNCLWAGPQPDQPSVYTVERGLAYLDGAPPPTYDTVMGEHDPPSYEKISKLFPPVEPPPSYAASVGGAVTHI